MRMVNVLLFGLHIGVVVWVNEGLENGLARTPPMGWLSWERYGCETDCKTFPSQCISQQLYVDMADRLVELGLDKLGYKYVNIDDCWSANIRSEDGELEEDKDRFPRGIKWLSDYIHSKGLLFGMYTDIGALTCGGYPGLEGHADRDLNKFLFSWNIDALKVDGCYANVSEMKTLYSELSDSLMRIGGTRNKAVLYSCSWPAYQTSDHCENENDMKILKEKCNLWRNFDDIQDSFSSVRSIANFFARNRSTDIMVSAAGPGHWNDPDMLVVGNPGLSFSEQRAQFALWAILAAPLYISADLRIISSESLSILMNEEVIAINQDVLGEQGYVLSPLSESGPSRVWVRHLTRSPYGEERRAVMFENISEIFGKIRFNFKVALLSSNESEPKSGKSYSVRDVFKRETVIVNESIRNPFIVDVDESSAELFLFTLHDSASPSVIKVVE